MEFGISNDGILPDVFFKRTATSAKIFIKIHMKLLLLNFHIHCFRSDRWKTYCNDSYYKGTHGIVLMGIADAD